MNNWKQRHFELLVKLRNICDENNINMILYGETARVAYTDNELSDTVQVAVELKDVRRLTEIIQNMEKQGESIACESMLNNDLYPAFNMRVYDTDSVDFDFYSFDRFKYHGLYITVHFISHLPNSKVKRVSDLSLVRGYRESRSFGIYGAEAHGYDKLWYKLNSGRGAKTESAEKLFSYLENRWSDPEGLLRIGRVTFGSRKLVSKTRTVSVNGESFKVPQKFKAFMEGFFDSGWSIKSKYEYTERASRFRTDEYSWDQLMKHVDIDIDEYNSSSENYIAVNQPWLELNRQVSQYYRLFYRTDDRFQLYLEYYPKKEKLMQMYDEGKMDELFKELEPYIVKLYSYKRNELGLCFDPDIFELTMDVIEAKFGKDDIDEFRALVPEAHRGDLVLKDYKGNIIDYSDIKEETPGGQEALKNLFSRLIEFFEQQGITYYLLGGSTIGAMRHGGFIPWDDDIDILLDRENYEKLFNCRNELPWDDLKLHFVEDNIDFLKPYAMISTEKDTWTSMGRMFWGGGCMGTTIDIMMTDNVPSDKMQEHMKNLLLYEESVSESRTYHRQYIMEYSDDYFDVVREKKKIGREAMADQLRSRLTSYPIEDCDKRVVRCWGRKLRDYDAEWLKEPQYYDFEGIRAAVPTCPEACLRLQYGYDWYVIPEESEQIAHNHAIVNRYISHNNYYDDVKSFFNQKDAIELLAERKLRFVKKSLAHEPVRQNKLAFLVARILVETGIESKAAELDEYYRTGNYDSFLKTVKPVFDNRALFAEYGRGEPILPDRQLNQWIDILIRTGEFNNANRVINCFVKERKSGEDYTDSLNLIGRLCKLAEYYQDRKQEELRECLTTFTEEETENIPDCILAKALLCRMEQEHDSGGGNTTEILELCEKYLAKYPVNYDILKAKADILYEGNGEAEAMALYNTVYSNSRNGLLLQELNRRFGFTKKL